MSNRLPTTIFVLAFAWLVGGLSGCDSGTAGDPVSGLKIGDLYPNATVKDCAGDDVEMSTWLGQFDVSYVSFGAKWCTACKLEAPILNTELVQAFADRSVGVAQLLIENNNGQAPPQALCSAWRDDLDAEFEVLVDPLQNSLLAHFGDQGITTLPVHYVVSRDGTIRLRKVGELPDNIQQLVADWLP